VVNEKKVLASDLDAIGIWFLSGTDTPWNRFLPITFKAC
jgi:hypothetical protein